MSFVDGLPDYTARVYSHADELDVLRSENRRLHAALEEIAKVNEMLRIENDRLDSMNVDIGNVHAERMDAAESRCERLESAIRGLLACLDKKEFAKDGRQQAVWLAESLLAEGER